MSHRDEPGPDRVTCEDLILVSLLGRYIERRDAGAPPRVHDLLAAAAEFGDDAAVGLRTLLRGYEHILANVPHPRRPR
jgi:hypothetical protein